MGDKSKISSGDRWESGRKKRDNLKHEKRQRVRLAARKRETRESWLRTHDTPRATLTKCWLELDPPRQRPPPPVSSTRLTSKESGVVSAEARLARNSRGMADWPVPWDRVSSESCYAVSYRLNPCDCDSPGRAMYCIGSACSRPGCSSACFGRLYRRHEGRRATGGSPRVDRRALNVRLVVVLDCTTGKCPLGPTVYPTRPPQTAGRGAVTQMDT